MITSQESVQEAGTARPIALSVASTLSWLWGILLILMMVAVLIPTVMSGEIPVAAVVLTGVAIGFCVAGYGLRKQRLYGAWSALAAAAVWLSAQVLGGAGLASIQGVVVGAIVLLVLSHWKHLG